MKKILFMIFVIFMTFITSGTLADSTQNIGFGSVVTVSVITGNVTSNFSYIPSSANFTLDPNQTMNFTFNVTNPTFNPLNITFRSQRFTNFSSIDFILSNETRIITAQLIPFNESGLFNESIQIARKVDSTLEVIGEIQIKFAVGKPPEKFTFMRCYIEEGIPKCSQINMTDYTNVTVINQTVQNITENQYFAVGKEFLEELMNSFRNNTEIIQSSLDQRNSEYENTFLLYNILNSKTGKLWYDISPDNELANITGLTSDELSTSIGKLLEQGLIKEDSREEEKQSTTKTGYIVRIVKITSIASVDRIKEKESEDAFYLSLIISAMCITIFVIVITIIILLRKRVF